MVNWDGQDKDLLALIKYTTDEDKLENPQVIKTPVVRNGNSPQSVISRISGKDGTNVFNQDSKR